MLVKRRTVPIKILQLEALLRRLPPQHKMRTKIEGELYRRKSGFAGEQSIDYYLSDLSKDYRIINDIRLSDGKKFFQIDTLILTPKYILIVEVKNFSGTLHFDDTHKQLIRSGPDGEEGYPDPVLQANVQMRRLRTLLKKSSIIEIPPTEYIVIISNPSTIIKSSPNSNLQNIVMHASRLTEKIFELDRKYSKNTLNQFQVEKMGKLLL